MLCCCCCCFILCLGRRGKDRRDEAEKILEPTAPQRWSVFDFGSVLNIPVVPPPPTPPPLPDDDSFQELSLFRRSLDTEATSAQPQSPRRPGLQQQLSNRSNASSVSSAPSSVSGFLSSLAESVADIAYGARSSLATPFGQTLDDVIALPAPHRVDLASVAEEQEPV